MLRFEVLTAVTMKNTILWDVMTYSLVEVYQNFGCWLAYFST
jgi:hypothetical protein